MDFRLSEQQLHLQQVARTFAYDEIQPRARELDRASDSRDSFPADLVRRASELGLRTMTIPVADGGMGVDCLTEVIVLEELAVGDVGFAMTLAHCWREGYFIATGTSKEQRDRFLPGFLADPEYLTSFGQTEETAGSDNGLPFTDDVSAGPQTSAVLRDGEWIINGGKRFITSGNVSRLMVMIARTDPTVPFTQGISTFLVPMDSPGVRTGRIESKLGLRLNQNVEVLFENCRLPSGNLVGEVNGGYAVLENLRYGSKTKEAARSLGVARAAFEQADAWVRTRVQGGRPIIEHQAVSTVMATMAMEIELARSLVWRAAWAANHDHDRVRPLEDMAKLYASEMALRVAAQSMQLFGARGALRDYPMEKLVRDAATMLLPPIGNTAVQVRLGSWLSRHQGRGVLIHDSQDHI
ncbi:MAG: acyl-CoA dehydrogenase family protein [Candidatus Dormibacteraceae bacterium]